MIDVSTLIPKLYHSLNEIGIDRYDTKLAYNDLNEAYEIIKMIGDTLDVDVDIAYKPTSLSRCILTYAKYLGYRNYTRLAEQQMDGGPSTNQIQVVYDTAECQRCLTYLFGVQFDETLLPKVLTEEHKPILLAIGPSIVDSPRPRYTGTNRLNNQI